MRDKFKTPDSFINGMPTPTSRHTLRANTAPYPPFPSSDKWEPDLNSYSPAGMRRVTFSHYTRAPLARIKKLHMKKLSLFGCFLTISILISAQQHRLDSIRARYLNRWVDKEIDSLLEKHITPKHNYYQFIPQDNSMLKIIWGNDSIKNILKNEYPDLFGIRQSLEFENDKFIFIHGWTGTGVWHNIVLPLKQGYGDFLIQNPIAYDLKNDRVATELCCMGDTLLEILDLKGQGSLYIIDSLIKCSSVQIDFCIDSIFLSDSVLTVNWIVPNKIDKPNSIIRKIYKIYAR